MKQDSQVFNDPNSVNKNTDVTSSVGFIAKVFLYMFVGLLISAAVCIAFSYLLSYAIGTGDANMMMTYLIILVVSLIALLITSFVITIKRIRMKNIVVPYVFYTVLMGIMLSSLIYWVGDPNVIGISLGITSLIFGITCLCAAIFKGKLAWVWGLLVGGIVSMGILSLVNLFLFPWAFSVESAFDASMTIYWIIEGIFIVVIIISTFLDMYNIKKIASYGSNDSNLALYCALNLYGDFIIIFVRILYIVMLAGGKSKD